jgi:hypothetical protein
VAWRPRGLPHLSDASDGGYARASRVSSRRAPLPGCVPRRFALLARTVSAIASHVRTSGQVQLGVPAAGSGFSPDIESHLTIPHGARRRAWAPFLRGANAFQFKFARTRFSPPAATALAPSSSPPSRVGARARAPDRSDGGDQTVPRCVLGSQGAPARPASLVPSLAAPPTPSICGGGGRVRRYLAGVWMKLSLLHCYWGHYHNTPHNLVCIWPPNRRRPPNPPSQPTPHTAPRGAPIR